VKSASLVVRVMIEGKRKNLSAEQAKQMGVSGTFYMRTWEGGKEKWKAIGTDPSQARIAVVRKEREFNGGGRITGSKTLREAIDIFLAERSVQQDVKTVNSWRNELARFEKITPKIYLKDIDRSDVFAYWNSYKAEGAAPRTIYNRVQSLTTFLKNQGVTGLLKHNELPKFQEKPVDYYNETNPSELDTYFAHCNPEERLTYLFFLFTGCREREAVFVCWQDLDFKNRTLTIRPKPELGFRTKNGSVRVVPIPQVLVDALKTYVLTIPTRRLIFTNASGGAEGHFLKKCKAIAKRAGLNCSHCVNKKGLSCAKHPVCDNWTLHKFRRTWATNHMLNGVPLPVIQQWIGHSDLETLNRYLAHISAKTDLAKQMADNLARQLNVGASAAEMMVEKLNI
jgi:integrase/recombinase XerD